MPKAVAGTLDIATIERFAGDVGSKGSAQSAAGRELANRV